MKKQYINPVISTITIPSPSIMWEVSTGTSDLPGSGIPGTTTDGIGQN